MGNYVVWIACCIVVFVLQGSPLANSKDNKIPVCKCNGHSSHCSTSKTHICIGCQHNTKGDYCEKCSPGYFGNASLGTPGACQKCPCDLTLSDGNCTLNSDNKVICAKCQPGYTGPQCKNCAVNYYYNKRTSTCVKCDCHGNSNPKLQQQCNATTGICLDCVNSSSGDFCEKCQPGYFILRDREVKRRCHKCFCNGNEDPKVKAVCYWNTGTCLSCVNNTAGSRCQSCAQGFIGDAIGAKNCTKEVLPGRQGTLSSNKSLVLTLSITLVTFISILSFLICFCWWRRRTLRSRARFVSVEMRGASISSSYDIGLIDPVTGEAVHDIDYEQEVDTLRMTNGNLQIESPYDIDISDTDRML